MQNKIMY